MSEQIYKEVSLENVIVRRQVRESFNEEELKRLTQSVRAQGVLQPLLVRLEGNDLILVDGERRLRAATRAGLKTVPVLVDARSLTPAEVLQWQLVTNCQRDGLTPMEQARAIKLAMDVMECSAAVIADRLGFSPATVSRYLALLTLPPSIQDKVEKGEVPASTAYEIARAGNASAQERLASEVTKGGLTRDAIAGKNKLRRAESAPTSVGAARCTVKLPGSRSIAVAGPGLTTLDVLISWLEELLGKARKARPRGVELGTFISLLKDEAKADNGSHS